jgi:hypothetical protein
VVLHSVELAAYSLQSRARCVSTEALDSAGGTAAQLTASRLELA